MIGPVSVQPSELAKLALAIWVAAFLARRPAPRTLGELLRPIGLVSGFAALLVLLEPDLGHRDLVRDPGRRRFCSSRARRCA